MTNAAFAKTFPKRHQRPAVRAWAMRGDLHIEAHRFARTEHVHTSEGYHTAGDPDALMQSIILQTLATQPW